jgi:hypothetical protein
MIRLNIRKKSRKEMCAFTEIYWLSVYKTFNCIADLKIEIENFQRVIDRNEKRYYSEKCKPIQEDKFQEIILILPIMKELNQIFLILEKRNHDSIYICIQPLT